ncbi:glutamine synthetase family protein [Kiloniella sp. b19]|uniref:glutamine synthetase family protein n=1 Tax=Kiloniella sp. GXU_MW_B19 TaxID=3141326 RepID=UPI0031D7A57E
MTPDYSTWPFNVMPGEIPTDPEALRSWMRERDIDEVECLTCDLAGIARGKAMPANKFAEMRSNYLPVSIYYQSITGDYADLDRDDEWTETDMCLVPVLSTLRTVPWAKYPTLQVIHDLQHQDGTPVGMAPRSVLKRVVDCYHALGLKPIVAPELEFYLTKKNTDPDYPLEPPVGRSGRQSVGKQSYSMAAVDEYEMVINDIYDFAESMGLEIDTIIQEGGAAQLEINLIHGDPVELADQVFVFKRLIREAAFRQGCYATFMAKPMDHEPGSAMHIHQSLVSLETGENVLSDGDGKPSELFYQFLAGQQSYIPAAMCIFAPYVNSYRRMVIGGAAPINLEWGQDNRSVGLRIPHSSPANRRVENRVIGADTNPYLSIAASLACGYLGIVEKLKPRKECTGIAYDADYTLPRSLLEALNLLDECPALEETLGKDFTDVYKIIKRHEFEEFMAVISPWEREHLLLTV